MASNPDLLKGTTMALTKNRPGVKPAAPAPPASEGAKAKRTRSKPAKADYDALAASMVETDENLSSARTVANNPFIGAIKTSVETGQRFSFTASEAVAKTASGKLNAGAKALNVGMRVQVSKPDQAGNVKVLWQAKRERKQVARKSKDAQETPA